MTSDSPALHKLRHGYAMRDLDDLTRIALSQTVDGRGLLSAADRYHVVWSGIALHLYEAEQRPTREELVAAGWRALAEARTQEMQAHGYVLDDGETRVRPRFAAYWHTPGESPIDRLIDRIAVVQSVRALNRAPREAVVAVAVLGSYDAAQDALGIKRARLTDRLFTARTRVLASWMPDETPVPPRYVHDRKPVNCGTPHGARAHRKRREKPCEACRAAAPPDLRNTGMGVAA